MSKKQKLIIGVISLLCGSLIIFLSLKNNHSKNNSTLKKEENKEIKNKPLKGKQKKSSTAPFWITIAIITLLIIIKLILRKYQSKTKNGNQQLVSDFSLFAFSWIITTFVYLFWANDFFLVDLQNPDPYRYLMFVRMVCEMVIYENCMLKITENSRNRYRPILKFDLNRFLEEFLFNPQKNPVRQRSRQIIFIHKNIFLLTTLKVFLYYSVGYLLILFFNFILNVYLHGFSPTCQQIKISYLWTFIPKMDKRYQRIIAYLFLGVPFIFIALFYYSYVHNYDFFFELQMQEDVLGRYWLMLIYYDYFIVEKVNDLFPEEKYPNKKFLSPITLKRLFFEEHLLNRNLDSTELDYFDENLASLPEHKKSFCQEGKVLLNDLQKFFNQENDFEKEVIENLQTFMKN